MSEPIEQVATPPPEEFWRRHVEAAVRFSGSNTEYCRQNGLNQKTLSFYKTKLGFSKRVGRPKAFVEVKPKLEAEPKPVCLKSEPKRQLPDAKWLAEFAITLLGSQLK